MSRLLTALTIGLVGLAVAGCGDPDPTASQAVARQFDGAPAMVQQRSILPMCGEEAVRFDTSANVVGRRCLWTAYLEHRPAEFVTTQSTIEGDPITYVYRILPGGAVELFIDSTHDQWSARTWLHLACPGLSLIQGAPDQPAFGPGLPGSDCTETTVR